MGMEVLDVIFRIERTFEIKLPRDELTLLMCDRDLRVGDLYDYVLKKLTLRDRARYDLHLNYELWRDIQRTLQFITSQPLEAITLGTSLKQLFPRTMRRVAWAAMQQTTTHRLAELEYPMFVHLAGWLLALGVVIVEQMPVWRAWANWLWPVLGIVGVWMIFETYYKLLNILAPLRTSLPYGMKTVKDLCRMVLADNYLQICRQAEVPIDERCFDVWHKLQGILEDALGVERSQITFQSQLVRDLGMS